MKALTVSQPFASLIATGEKFVENRTYQISHRGELAIHAGKGRQYLTKTELAAYPTGHVIAVAKLVACVKLSEVAERGRFTPIEGSRYTVGDILDHEHTEGPWCWILEDIRKLKVPKQINGQQGLWVFHDREWDSRF